MKSSQIREIRRLVEAGETDIECEAVKNSKFYKLMLTEKELIVLCVKPEPEELSLIVKIAAISHKLERVCLMYRESNEHGPQIFGILSRSYTIKEIDVTSCIFGAHAVETFSALASLISLETLICKGVTIENKIEASKALAKLSSLKKLDIGNIDLSKEAPEVITNLSALKKLEEIAMSNVGLGVFSHGEVVAKCFNKYPSIRKIIFDGNGLASKIVGVAREFVEIFKNRNESLKVSLLDNSIYVNDDVKHKSTIVVLQAEANEAKRTVCKSMLTNR